MAGGSGVGLLGSLPGSMAGAGWTGHSAHLPGWTFRRVGGPSWSRSALPEAPGLSAAPCWTCRAVLVGGGLCRLALVVFPRRAEPCGSGFTAEPAFPRPAPHSRGALIQERTTRQPASMDSTLSAGQPTRDGTRRSVIGLVAPSRVNAESCRAAAAVTESAGDGPQVDAGGQELGGGVVAQLVKVAGEAESLDESAVALRRGVRRQGLTAIRVEREHVPVLGQVDAEHLGSTAATPGVLAEDGDGVHIGLITDEGVVVVGASLAG